MNQSRRALEYLHPDNLPIRTAATMTLNHAYQLQGNRSAALQAFSDVIAISNASKESIYTTAVAIYLGQLQEADNQLSLATTTYRLDLQLAGDPPDAMAATAYLGLARICYQWNDIESAEEPGQQCINFLRQMYSTDTIAAYNVFLARLKLAQGDIAGAGAILAEPKPSHPSTNLCIRCLRLPPRKCSCCCSRAIVRAAAHLAQARVHLAQENTSAALALLEPLHRQMEAKGWVDEQLKVLVLEAIALHAHGEMDEAV